jgi:hypothetical protein
VSKGAHITRAENPVFHLQDEAGYHDAASDYAEDA